MPNPARTTLAANPQNRVAPGTPNGGEFTFTPRSESDVSLVDVHPAIARTETPLTDAQLAEQSRISARYWVFSKNLRFTDPDDIAQSTVETVLRARMNDERLVITERYVHTVASGHVAIALRGILRNEDRKARGIYDRRIAETETEQGRAMTPKEKVALAQDIRDTWPDQRHKPSEKFVELSDLRFLSLNAPVGTSEDTLIDHIAATRGHTDEDLAVEPDSLAGQALLMAEGKRKPEAKRAAWNAIAELNDAPHAIPASISAEKATAYRAAVRQAGGVSAAISDWNNGELTPAASALFAPFGDLDESGRDDVCDLLSRLHTNAEDLYDSALKWAVIPRRS